MLPKVRVLVPDVTILAGAKEKVAPLGTPVAVSATVPVNPPAAVTVAVEVAVAPLLQIETAEGEVATENDGPPDVIVKFTFDTS